MHVVNKQFHYGKTNFNKLEGGTETFCMWERYSLTKYNSIACIKLHENKNTHS